MMSTARPLFTLLTNPFNSSAASLLRQLMLLPKVDLNLCQAYVQPVFSSDMHLQAKFQLAKTLKII